jgi:hypothetical protein
MDRKNLAEREGLLGAARLAPSGPPFGRFPLRRLSILERLQNDALAGPQKFGGERGIRTLEGLLTLTPLAGVRLRPLGHLSVRNKQPERRGRGPVGSGLIILKG